MPLIPEEPKIQQSTPGGRNSAAATRTPQASRPAAPVPGPRAGSRPAPPRADSKGPSSGRPPGAPRGGAPQRPAAAPAPRSAPQTPQTAQIELVAATGATAVDVADETVDKLLDEGVRPGDVLVVTTGEQHPWAQHELSFGEDAYWRQFAEGEDVFCVHTAELSRTGRRAVVVLAVNGGTDAQAAEALPAALAQAGSTLYVVGDPQRLRQLL